MSDIFRWSSVNFPTLSISILTKLNVWLSASAKACVDEQNMQHIQQQDSISPLDQQVTISAGMLLMERVESTYSVNVDPQNEADKRLAQAEELPMEFGFNDLLNLHDFD